MSRFKFSCFSFIAIVAVIYLHLVEFKVSFVSAQEDQILYSSAYEQDLSPEIETLKTQLLVQLTQYQQDEREFRIAREQYKTLQTLNSIEATIGASKQAMHSRNIVLATYLEILRLRVNQTAGFQLSHKTRALALIETDKAQLLAFDAQIEQPLNREAMNQLSAQFVPIGNQVKQNSYYILSCLAIARLQAVHNQSQPVKEAVTAIGTNEAHSIEESQKLRAINEANKVLDLIPTKLDTVWNNAATAQAANRNEAFYRNLTKELAPIYSLLSQSISYFTELEAMK